MVECVLPSGSSVNHKLPIPLFQRVADGYAGLINNIFYVIILSAALDLVGPSIPKASVLLASIIPGLLCKLTVPYFIHLVPYSARILIFCSLSTIGMLAVALSPAEATHSSITAKLVGIVLANLSSGAGEVNFLALTAFYGHFSLAAWGSGTGGAGLIGAGAYSVATVQLGVTPHAALLASTVLPFVMLLSFFVLLPRGPLKLARRLELEYHPITSAPPDEGEDDEPRESAGLLDQPSPPPVSPTYSKTNNQNALSRALSNLQANLARAKPLITPYMIPLFLVYLAEYTINQGVAPTLLFPLASSPFQHYRAFYPTYSTLYQAGVFISRSSLALFRIRALYTPSILQCLNLGLLTAHALVPFIPSVYWIFGIMFWEGLLGGLVYVSTFAAVREEVGEEDREFSLGAVTVADSAGIFLAGLVGMGMETAICTHQVADGRDWCRRL